MHKLIMLSIAVAMMPSAGSVQAGDHDNFGGNGQAWVEMIIGGSTYWDHALNDNLSKDWETPDGSSRFTQPGNAEGNANGNSVIEYYPCSGIQVYPGGNN